MPSKIIWIDTETTGTFAVLHSIVQIAGIIDIDGITREVFELKCQPHPDSEIDEKALRVNGFSMDDLKSFPTAREAHFELLKIFEKYIDKFNKADKFSIAGKNVQFDLGFLSQFFTRLNDNYLGSWIDFRRRIEIEDTINAVKSLGYIQSDSLTLQAICKEFKIPISAHDALSDITATRELYYFILNNLRWEGRPYVHAKKRKTLSS